ncbi:lipocalin family protein [Frigoriflavimonas asaccharolytica]|uniref:Lipocalin-like domain-containing protein n=1 Tax=Frigoriflavimonas asaccharolytica TaxID=2735899 RepID=A0A8J8K9K1_9FLAO|nr:lipocalin family protein [Frigoriflavimonas asaccharolytica]NRS93888.1 hypothetical protein [Frigoriflavimonas asaccharolytica]
MKKYLLSGIIAVSFLTSCATVKKAETKQEDRKEFLAMKGEWEITSIDYAKGLKIKPFDENIDANCFVGSHWTLIPNNYTGSYTINSKGNCPSIIQPIKFEVENGNTFLFKKIMAGEKAKNNVVGYQMTLISQSTDQFSLQSSIPFEGETVNVVYNFQRTGMKQ